MKWLPIPTVPILLVPILLTLAGCATGPSLDTALREAADAELARRPADYRHGDARAWMVSKDGAGRALLWGTVHVGYSGATVLPRPIRAMFYEAADLTVETVVDRLPTEEDQRLRTLFRQAELAVDPAALARLDAMTRQALDRTVPPVFAREYSLRGLAQLVAARALQGDALPDLGPADLNLINFARSQGRPVLGLEPPQTPDPTLSDPNGADAEALLRQYLRRFDTFRGMSAWSLDSYASGDVARTLAILVAWRSEPADLARNDRDRPAELGRRNAAWVPRLQEIMAPPGLHFVAVGAGHLLGDDGLVALLRARGYTVVPCPGDVCPP